MSWAIKLGSCYNILHSARIWLLMSGICEHEPSLIAQLPQVSCSSVVEHLA